MEKNDTLVGEKRRHWNRNEHSLRSLILVPGKIKTMRPDFFSTTWIEVIPLRAAESDHQVPDFAALQRMLINWL